MRRWEAYQVLAGLQDDSIFLARVQACEKIDDAICHLLIAIACARIFEIHFRVEKRIAKT